MSTAGTAEPSAQAEPAASPERSDSDVSAADGDRAGGAETGAVSPDVAGEGSPEDEGSLVAPLDATTTVAVQGAGTGVEAPADPLPLAGGTLRVAVDGEADGLNPAANNFAVSAYVMAYPMFDPLAYFDAEGNWIPYLAESFTSNDDATVWRMRLREGVRFHDGTEMTADDVVATISAREWQRADRSFWRSKNSDTFKPMGPWIETDVDPMAQTTFVRVNGETRAEFATGGMVFDPWDFIVEASRYITFHPGDVLWMGADSNCQIGPGDVVDVEVTGIGVLSNPVEPDTR